MLKNACKTAEVAILTVETGLTSDTMLSKSMKTNFTITEAESVDFTTKIMVIDCNIKIVGSGTSYLQVLHTLNVVQILNGVQFDQMGHAYNVDHYPIQFKYCHSAAGSDISHNPITSSKQCCISINGTSDVTVSNKMALPAPAMCYHVGNKAENNVFEKNIAAKSVKMNTGTLYPHGGFGPSFLYYWPNNHFIGNVASGGD
eukprot:6682827-Ditylum_brightwellii.AAC.1